jgi:hypothetical protein
MLLEQKSGSGKRVLMILLLGNYSPRKHKKDLLIDLGTVLGCDATEA